MPFDQIPLPFGEVTADSQQETRITHGQTVLVRELAGEEGERGILATALHADGRHNQLLYVDGGPSTTGTVGKLRMKGQEVFRHAVVNLAAVLTEVVAKAGVSVA